MTVVGRRCERHFEDGTAVLLEVTGFLPRLEAWTYTPPRIDEDPIHPDLDERERPAMFSGMDVTKCTVAHIDPTGEVAYHHASLNRSVHSDHGDGARWSTSCMARHATGVRVPYSDDREVRADHHRGDYDMLWDSSQDGPVTIDDLCERACEAVHDWYIEGKRPHGGPP